MGSQARHGAVSLCVVAVLHEPTRRLGAEPNTQTEEERWNECRAELETPGDIAGVHDDAVGRETQEDTCFILVPVDHTVKRNILTSHNPKLPEHDEGTADTVRCHLSREDRDRGVLCTDADAHDESRSKQGLPGVCEPGADGRGSEDDGSDKYLTATTEVMVERVDDEGAAVYQVSTAK